MTHTHTHTEGTMNQLTMRSKIAVRWTTDPADLGYGGRPTNWRESKPEMMGIKRAVGFGYELGQKIGLGTYRAIEYRHRGRVISLDEIAECLANAEYRALDKYR